MIFKKFKKIFCIYLLCFSSLTFTSSWDKFLSVCCCCYSYSEKNESSSVQNSTISIPNLTITSVNERPVIYTIESEENKICNNAAIVKQDNSRPLTPTNSLPEALKPIAETSSNQGNIDPFMLRTFYGNENNIIIDDNFLSDGSDNHIPLVNNFLPASNYPPANPNRFMFMTITDPIDNQTHKQQSSLGRMAANYISERDSENFDPNKTIVFPTNPTTPILQTTPRTPPPLPVSNNNNLVASIITNNTTDRGNNTLRTFSNDSMEPIDNQNNQNPHYVLDLNFFHSEDEGFLGSNIPTSENQGLFVPTHEPFQRRYIPFWQE